MKHQERTIEGGNNALWVGPIWAMLKGLGVALGTIVVGLGLAASLISHGMLQERWMDLVVLLLCGFGNFLGGIVAGKGWKQGRGLRGMVVGVSCFVVLLLLGFLLVRQLSIWKRGIPTLIVCVLGGALSGLLREKGKKKHRRSLK